MQPQNYHIEIRATLINFTNYLKNKSIALVGRSGYILKYKNGEFIDSHDIVIRVNNPDPYTIPPNKTNVHTEEELRIDELNERKVFVPPEYYKMIGATYRHPLHSMGK